VLTLAGLADTAPDDEPLPETIPDDTGRARRRRVILWSTLATLAAFAVVVLIPALRRANKPPAPPPPAGKAAVDSPAHELYLKGRYYWTRRTDGSLKQAIDAFAQAVEKDPNYAPAYAGLADSYNLMPEYSSMPRSQAFPLALAAARRAVALDDSLSEAHRSLAFAEFYWNWDVDGAFREFERAIQLNPKDVEAHSWYATSLLLVRRTAAARAQIAQARELNPASRAILADEALIRYGSGEHAAAIAELKELEQTEPDFIAPPRYLADISFGERNYPDYIAALKRAAAISNDPEETALAATAERGWSQGGEHALLEALRVFYRSQFDRGLSSGFLEARVCAMLGRKDEADHYLQAAFDSRDYLMMSILDNGFDGIMSNDPLFQNLEVQIRERMHPAPASSVSR
jgi:tetratricopeptide (TPR) repeat protein